MKLIKNYIFYGEGSMKYLKFLLCAIPLFFILFFTPKTEAAELSTGFYTISPSDNLTVRLNVENGK